MNWPELFFQMCDTVAQKSKDTSTKVGCVIVGPDLEIRSTGFNGFPRGARDKTTNTIPRGKIVLNDGKFADLDETVLARYERPLKYKWTEHAERNAIYNAARVGIPLKGCELYCASNPSFPPCSDCARAIIQSGIVAVHLRPCKIPDRWREDCEISLAMMEECGVSVLYHDIDFKVINKTIVPNLYNGPKIPEFYKDGKIPDLPV